MGTFIVTTRMPSGESLIIKVIHEQSHCISNGCDCDADDFETTTGKSGETTFSLPNTNKVHYFRGLREDTQELISVRAKRCYSGGKYNFLIEMDFTPKPKCISITLFGTRCARPAEPPRAYCWQHPRK